MERGTPARQCITTLVRLATVVPAAHVHRSVVDSPSMKVLSALLLATTLAGCASAPPPGPPAGSEELRIEATVQAVYNAISGPAGPRDWRVFEALFAPDARMVVSTTKDGAPGTVVMTTKDYIARSTPAFDEKGFFERPVATRTLRYGNIAHVWSTYEAREAANQQKPFMRGINSFTLVRIGNEWKVQSLVWQRETPELPLPSQFAPQ